MIKVVLKHWIYEKCIDVLFKNIGVNFHVFKPIKFGPHLFSLFEVYTYIKTVSHGNLYIFYDVIVHKIRRDNIRISCSSCVTYRRDSSKHTSLSTDHVRILGHLIYDQIVEVG